jgi:hypothetical protein
MKKRKLGQVAGSIAAYGAMYSESRSTAPKELTEQEKRQRDWDAFKEEERAEQERKLAPVRKAQEELNRTLRAAQAQELLTLSNDSYLAEHCGQTERENTPEAIRNAFLAFRDVLLSKGTTITDAGVELLGRISDLNPKVDWASTSPLTFHTLWTRVEGLGLVKENTHYTVSRVEQPAPTQQLSDREQCETDYVNAVLPLMDAWETSLLEKWGVTLTPQLREEVSNIMRRHNLNPTLSQSYDFCRIQMAKRGLLKTDKYADGRPLTRDERVSETMEKIDLSTSEGRRWFCEEQDLLLHGE